MLFSSHPVLTWQQAINEHPDSAPYKDMGDLLDDQQIEMPQGMILKTNKSALADPCVLTIANLQEVTNISAYR